jgi:hypothetical protein
VKEVVGVNDPTWLATVLFLFVGGFAFLMLLAGARGGVLKHAEQERRRREAEEQARRKAVEEQKAEVVEVEGIK